jgi:hypothetical protein
MGEGWFLLALTAAVAGVAGFVLGRVRWRRVAPAGETAGEVMAVLRALAAEGAALDLLPHAPAGDPEGGPGGEPLARCLLKSAGPEGLGCELLGSVGADALVDGRELDCHFAPRRVGGRRVSAFVARVAGVDAAGDPPGITLSAPEGLLDLPRRRHTRKRVSDQRFVRLRLWLADWRVSRLHFPEAAPDVWINAYDGNGGGDSAVTDISAGGLAITLRASGVPGGLAPGSQVVLKCSLFQFKEKQFRPYWYAGLVRAVDGDSGLVRIAVAFTAVGRADPAAPQGVAWEERRPGAATSPKGITGGSA